LRRRAGRSDPFAYTISHFKKIARWNLFPENATIAHDTRRCTICHPDLAGKDPFAAYLEVAVESILVRRPKLDDALAAEINMDRAFAGLEMQLTIERLLEGDRDALDSWAGWAREALAVGLGLLSVHSPTSLDFDLDEQEANGHGALIDSKIQRIIGHQKKMTA
jgi:hypothetical protein